MKIRIIIGGIYYFKPDYEHNKELHCGQLVEIDENCYYIKSIGNWYGETEDIEALWLEGKDLRYYDIISPVFTEIDETIIAIPKNRIINIENRFDKNTKYLNAKKARGGKYEEISVPIYSHK